MMQVMLDSVFELQDEDKPGLDVPKWDLTKDLSPISKEIRTNETLLQQQTVHDLSFIQQSLLKHRSVVVEMQDHKLVEKVVPYTSLMNAKQAMMADVFRSRNIIRRIKSDQLPLVVSYAGFDTKAWEAFWLETVGWPVDCIRFQKAPECTKPSRVVWIDTINNQPRLDDLPNLVEVSQHSIYIERVDMNNLQRYLELANRFQKCWFISSCHSGFPQPAIHIICLGYNTNTQRTCNLLDIYDALASTLERIYHRKQRSIARWEWIKLFPRFQRAKLTSQPTYKAWEDGIHQFWTRTKQQVQRTTVPSLSPTYAPVSPTYAPTSPGYAPISPSVTKADATAFIDSVMTELQL